MRQADYYQGDISYTQDAVSLLWYTELSLQNYSISQQILINKAL